MWQWLKTNVFNPVAQFFKGIYNNYHNIISPTAYTPLAHQTVVTNASNIGHAATPDKSILEQTSQTTDTLSKLPKDIRHNEIYLRSPLSVLGILAQTSKQYEADTAFLRLLPASIHAAPAFMDPKKDATALAVIAILKKHPELLFKTNPVTDHYGRKIFASPYQIFLGAGDIWATRKIHEDILPLIENGQVQAEAQFRKQFPNCPWPLPQNFSEEMLYDDRNKRQIKAIVEQLVTVKQCIETDHFNNNQPLNATKQAVEALCQLFQPTPGEVIRSGLHFPLAIIYEVYKTYNALQNDWTFFSLAVIKPALDALSTVDAQCCQDGLSQLDVEKGPNRRCHPAYQQPLGKPLSLKLVNDLDKRGVAVLVDLYNGEVLSVSSTPGYLDFLDKNGECVGCVLATHSHVRVLGRRASLSALEKLCRIKTSGLQNSYAATSKSEIERVHNCLMK